MSSASECARAVFHLIDGITEHMMLGTERFYPQKLREGVPHWLGGSIEGEGCKIETGSARFIMRVVEWMRWVSTREFGKLPHGMPGTPGSPLAFCGFSWLR